MTPSKGDRGTTCPWAFNFLLRSGRRRIFFVPFPCQFQYREPYPLEYERPRSGSPNPQSGSNRRIDKRGVGVGKDCSHRSLWSLFVCDDGHLVRYSPFLHRTGPKRAGTVGSVGRRVVRSAWVFSVYCCVYIAVFVYVYCCVCMVVCYCCL